MPESSSKQNTTEPARPGSRARRVAFWSLFSVAALLATLGILLFTADLGALKPQIERWVSAKTGRELRIDGPLIIQLGATSNVRAENIRFSNAAWADKAEMVEVGVLQVRFDLWSLLGDQFIVELIDIDNARVHLEVNEANDSNWALGVAEGSSDPGSGAFGVLLEQLDVDNVQLIYDASKREQPLVVQIDVLDQQHRRDDFLELLLQGTIGGREIEARGRMGTWSALLNGKDIQYDLEGHLDTVALSSEGTIDDLAEPSRPRLVFSIFGPDIQDLTRMFGIRDDATGSIDLRGSLTPTPDGPLVLNAIGNAGEAELEARGSFSDLQNLDQIDIDLLASGPNLGRILSMFGVDQVREAAFMIDVNATRNASIVTVEQAKMVFGESHFDLTANLPHFPSLDDGVIDLDVSGPDLERLRYLLRLPGAASGPFSLSFGLEVSPLGEETIRLQGTSNLGTIEASGSLGPPPGHFGSRTQFRVTSDDLAQLGRAWGIDNLPERPLEVTGAIEYAEHGLQMESPLVADVNGVIAKVEGLIVPRVGLLGTDVTFSLTGPDLAALTAAFGAGAGVPDEAYVFDGQLQIRDDGYRFRDVSGTIGSSVVDVDGLLSLRRGLAGTRFEFEASGPAFEEMIDELGDLEVRPGRYDLNGRIEVERDRLRLRKIDLDRPRGDLQVNLELGWPLSERWADFDLRGRGTDVRDLFQGIDNFEVDEAPFTLAAIGEWRSGDWSFDKYSLEIADASTFASGTLEFDDGAPFTRFQFSGNIPSLARIGTINGYRMRDQSLTWQGLITGGDGMLGVDNLVATLGDSDINGTVVYRVGDIPELDVDIRSESIVFVPLMEERQYDPEPEFKDGRLIPDVPIPFDAMKSINANFRLEIGELIRDSLHMRDIEVDASLQDGTFELSRFGFRGRAGRLDAKAILEPAAGAGRAAVELIARDFAFGMAELNQDLAMTGDIDVKLKGAGTDLRSLLGNSNGVVFVKTRGGRFTNNRFMGAIYGDILDEVLGAINPFFTADQHTNLDCVIFPYEINDGQVATVPNSFISTGKIRIASKGAIDLKTEEIELNIRTTPKKSLGISAGELVNPYIKIVGTLGSPRVAIDEAGVLITGGAAFATGGLSILARAAWDRLSRAEDPCADTVEKAIEALGDRFPVWDTVETVESDR